MSAMPIGVPGWPDFAFSTASTARKRMVLTQSSSSLSFWPIFGSLLSSATAMAVLASWAAPPVCCSIAGPPAGDGLYSAHPIHFRAERGGRGDDERDRYGQRLSRSQSAEVHRRRAHAGAAERRPGRAAERVRQAPARTGAGHGDDPGVGAEQVHRDGGEGEGPAARPVRAPRRARGG